MTPGWGNIGASKGDNGYRNGGCDVSPFTADVPRQKAKTDSRMRQLTVLQMARWRCIALTDPRHALCPPNPHPRHYLFCLSFATLLPLSADPTQTTRWHYWTLAGMQSQTLSIGNSGLGSSQSGTKALSPAVPSLSSVGTAESAQRKLYSMDGINTMPVNRVLVSSICGCLFDDFVADLAQ